MKCSQNVRKSLKKFAKTLENLMQQEIAQCEQFKNNNKQKSVSIILLILAFFFCLKKRYGD